MRDIRTIVNEHVNADDPKNRPFCVIGVGASVVILAMSHTLPYVDVNHVIPEKSSVTPD